MSLERGEMTQPGSTGGGSRRRVAVSAPKMEPDAVRVPAPERTAVPLTGRGVDEDDLPCCPGVSVTTATVTRGDLVAGSRTACRA